MIIYLWSKSCPADAGLAEPIPTAVCLVVGLVVCVERCFIIGFLAVLFSIHVRIEGQGNAVLTMDYNCQWRRIGVSGILYLKGTY